MPGTGYNAQTSTYLYDFRGRRKTVTNPDNSVVTSKYYATGQVWKQYGGQNYPVEYGYDAQGRMTSMKTWGNFANDTGARTTEWTYDPVRGWLTTKKYPDNKLVTYHYYKSGRIKTKTGGRNIVSSYTYNFAGDLGTISYSDGSIPQTVLAYDRTGQRTTVTQGGSVLTSYFNNWGMQTGESYLGGSLGGLSVTNKIDGLFRLTEIGVNEFSAETTASYAYGNDGRLSDVTSGSSLIHYNYLTNSQLIQSTEFKTSGAIKMTTTRAYDNLNRLESITSGAGRTYAYKYNDANQRYRVTADDNSYSVYGYDALGQVTSAKKHFTDQSLVPGQQFEYVFDDIGNRTSTVTGGDQAGNNTRSATYVPNNNNQYESRTVPGYVEVSGSAATGSTVLVNGTPAFRKADFFRQEIPVVNTGGSQYPSITVQGVLPNSNSQDILSTTSGKAFVPPFQEVYQYDDDGNLTQDGRWIYTWDAENRLKSMTSLQNTPQSSWLKLTFEYDFMGRRISKKVQHATTYGAWTTPVSEERFVYQGWNLIAVLNPVLTTVAKSFVWGTDLSGSFQGSGGVGGLLSETLSGAVNFPYYDGNGNVTGLASGGSGTSLANYEYGPFGESIRVSGSSAISNPFRFSTKYQDDETDLIYYGYRYYGRNAGIWLSRDPAHEPGFNLMTSGDFGEDIDDSGNLYGFVDNNAISGVDSLGLFLAAIDGTGSRKWLKIDPKTGRFNSHVRNFYEDYSGPGAKQYWNGPNLVGGGVSAAVDEVYKKICQALKVNPREQINIVGHSRGGLIAILVAKKLKDKPCSCVENKVHFMGLYDAVDRYLWANAGTIPDNVQTVAHARRDKGVHSRPTFGNTGTSGGQSYEEQIFWVTHGGAGGDPWGGDHPTIHGKPTITQEQDEAGSKKVDAWIRSRFH